MQNVKTALEDFGIDKNEILSLLENDEMFQAIRIIETKTNFNMTNTMHLLNSIHNKEEQFTYDFNAIKNNQKVNYENKNDDVTVTFSENGEPEKVIDPNDKDWPKVRKALNHIPEIAEYEKEFLENTINHPKKSSLFVEESPVKKWKYFVLIVAILAAAYYLYQNY